MKHIIKVDYVTNFVVEKLSKLEIKQRSICKKIAIVRCVI